MRMRLISLKILASFCLESAHDEKGTFLLEKNLFDFMVLCLFMCNEPRFLKRMLTAEKQRCTRN